KALPHFLKQLDAIHPGHADIGHQHIDRTLLQDLQRLGTAGGELQAQLVAQGAQHAAQPLQDARLVIHEQNATGHAPPPRSTTGARGNWIINVVPWPTSVSKLMPPPCFWTTTA